MCADVERRNQVDRLLRGQVVGAGKREMGLAVKTDRRRQTEQGSGRDSNLSVGVLFLGLPTDLTFAT